MTTYMIDNNTENKELEKEKVAEWHEARREFHQRKLPGHEYICTCEKCVYFFIGFNAGESYGQTQTKSAGTGTHAFGNSGLKTLDIKS